MSTTNWYSSVGTNPAATTREPHSSTKDPARAQTFAFDGRNANNTIATNNGKNIKNNVIISFSFNSRGVGEE
jgi:hypothetical protein